MSDVINAKLAKSVQDAISGDIKLGGVWLKVGTDAREAYPSEAALLEAKAFFIDSYIIPAMPGATKILAVVQHRKGSPAYLEACAKDATYEGQHRAADDAKKSVRAMAHTYFARAAKYAYPKEKAVPEPRSLKTRIQEDIAALIKACEKAEDAPFNLTKTVAALNAVLAEVNAK